MRLTPELHAYITAAVKAFDHRTRADRRHVGAVRPRPTKDDQALDAQRYVQERLLREALEFLEAAREKAA
jgi:hypothetical protein